MRFAQAHHSETVQALLGHSSPEVTHEIHIHAILDDQPASRATSRSACFGPKWTQVLG